MENLYVVPAAGGRVRQPERGGRVMPETGDWVPNNSFWQRLLAGGDVVAAKPPKKSAPVANAGQSAKPTTSSGRGRRASAAPED